MRKLTEKQEKFAQAVGVEGVSQSEAYRRVYSAGNMKEKAIWIEACRVAKTPSVAARIAELKAERAERVSTATAFDVRKLLETYIAIAFVDPNELTQVRIGACRHCWGVGHEYHWRAHEYEQALRDWEAKAAGAMPAIAGGLGYRATAEPNPDCPQCDGEGVTRLRVLDTTKLSEGARLLYQGVQQTREGVKILFASKDKALEQIGRIIGAYDDKLRIDLQGKVASMRLETSDPKEAAEAYMRLVKGS